MFFFAAAQMQAKDGDQITLQAGCANVIWQSTTAFYDVDWSEATVEGVSWDGWLEAKGPDFVKDWPSDKSKLDASFIHDFNKKTSKNDGLRLQNDNPEDRYQFIIHLQEIDMGSIGGGVVASAFLGAFARKAGGVNLKKGYIDIIDRETNKVVCRMAFNNVRGDNAINYTAMLILAFMDMRDEVIGYAKRKSGESMPEIEAPAAKKETKVEEEPMKEEVKAEPAPAPAPAAKAKTPAKRSTAKGKRGKTAGRSAATSRAKAKTPAAKSSTASRPAQGTAEQTGGKLVTVKLTTGTTITGIMKSFDPLSQIVIVVAGQETTIPMSKVANVEMPK